MKIAAVSYLNTAPLIEGLEAWDGCEMVRVVPAEIAGMVVGGAVDLGLVSVVDFAETGSGGDSMVMIPVGMIGCGGETLTVRLFSSVPIEEISVVHGDVDSHSSVVLCDLVLRGLGVEAGFVGFDFREGVVVGGGEGGKEKIDGIPGTVLMIGDKVVVGSGWEDRYPYQIDLGEAWLRMTGLPFVYAVWMCRADRVGDEEIRAGAMVLERVMLRNRMRMDWIVGRHAGRTGWPVELAERYLGELLRFEVDDLAREAVGEFLKRAADAGLVGRVEPRWMELGCCVAGDTGGSEWCLR